MSTARAVRIEVGGKELLGIAHVPDVASSRCVLIVVGGPQYRVGSHRQFVLLARDLADNGVTAFRLDHSGIGDSEGEQGSFEEIAPDIRAAIDELFRQFPGLDAITIWGLCDAASAACMYVGDDHRVDSLVLLNPWFREGEALSHRYLFDHYMNRIGSRKFWQDLLRGNVRIRATLRALFHSSRQGGDGGANDQRESSGTRGVPSAFRERMLAGLQKFQGNVLLILSGEDVTAREFESVTKGDRRWRKVLRRSSVTTRRLRDANHTFASREWRAMVSRWTLAWLREL